MTSPQAPGSEGAFGFRVEARVGVFEVLGFGTRRTEVALLLFSADGKVPAKQRDRLFATLVERGIAHAL